MTKRIAPSNPAIPVSPPRTYATVQLGAIVPKITRPAFKKKSPAGALLMSDWGLVVGPELAAITQPERLSGTALTISCVGPTAMQLSHQADALITRINSYAGLLLVENLRFVQGMQAAPHLNLPVHRSQPIAIEGFPPGEVHDALARLAAALGTNSRNREN